MSNRNKLDDLDWNINIGSFKNKRVKDLSDDEIDEICKKRRITEKHTFVHPSLLNQPNIFQQKTIRPFSDIRNYEDLKERDADLKLDKMEEIEADIKNDIEEIEESDDDISLDTDDTYLDDIFTDESEESVDLDDIEDELSLDDELDRFDDNFEIAPLNREIKRFDKDIKSLDRDVKRLDRDIEHLAGRKVEELEEGDLKLICKYLAKRYEPNRSKFIELYNQSRSAAYKWAVNHKYVPKYEDINFEEDAQKGYLYIPALLHRKAQYYKDQFLQNTIGMYTVDIVYNITNVLFVPKVEEGVLYIMLSPDNTENVNVDKIKELDFELIRLEPLKFKYTNDLIYNPTIEEVLIPEKREIIDVGENDEIKLNEGEDIELSEYDAITIGDNDEIILDDNEEIVIDKDGAKVREKVDFYEKWLEDRVFY